MSGNPEPTMRQYRRSTRIALTGALTLALIAGGVLGFRTIGPGAEASHAGGMDAMNIDMDPAGNTASGLPVGHTEVLGTVQACARVNENDALDADEDSVDTLQVDVTAVNIPASNPMIGFGFTLRFPDTSVLIATENQDFLLASLAGSALVRGLSDPLPDTNDSSLLKPGWDSAAADFGPMESSESGSGVLDRLEIQTFTGSVSGRFPLTLIGNGHVDTLGIGIAPDVTNNAEVAVNQPCPEPATPTPSPTSTLTPTPTPSPTPVPFSRGDVNCDGEVNHRDVRDLRQYVHGRSVSLPVGCAPIGGSGDFNCDGAVNAADVDALKKHVQGRPVDLPPGCPPIGS